MNLKSFYSYFEGRIFPASEDDQPVVTITMRDYEDIQYHAWKEGMTRAAEIARGQPRPDEETTFVDEDIAAEIEAERDTTNTLWPRPVL